MKTAERKLAVVAPTNIHFATSDHTLLISSGLFCRFGESTPNLPEEASLQASTSKTTLVILWGGLPPHFSLLLIQFAEPTGHCGYGRG